VIETKSHTEKAGERKRNRESGGKKEKEKEKEIEIEIPRDRRRARTGTREVEGHRLVGREVDCLPERPRHRFDQHPVPVQGGGRRQMDAGGRRGRGEEGKAAPTPQENDEHVRLFLFSAFVSSFFLPASLPPDIGIHTFRW